VSLGLGFAWLPELNIQAELAAGKLKPLPLNEGAERFAEMYKVFADRDYAGPATHALAEIIQTEVTQACKQAGI
jgi:DNA-binding transcriptional LysR family regulator